MDLAGRPRKSIVILMPESIFDIKDTFCKIKNTFSEIKIKFRRPILNLQKLISADF